MRIRPAVSPPMPCSSVVSLLSLTMAFCLLAGCWLTSIASAQNVIKVAPGPDNKFQVIGGGENGPVVIQGGPGAPPPGAPGQGKPPGGGPEGAPGGKPPGPENAPKQPSKDAPAAEVTRRATEPPSPPNPAELKVRPDDDGKLAFSFRNQPWPALMDWLAEVSGEPLDWQELPVGYVNMSSPGRYTLAETRDLFNRHLLARGFTMLELDGGLTVVKTEGINPAVVPRVHPTQLADLQPYTFVRTSLDCGWLLANKLATELKPLISTNGQLIALEQTNRLEAMDAAVNLQQIAGLLTEEQTGPARDDLAREFELRHVPASEAKDMLARFLGVEEKKAPVAMSPQQARQMQMMQQQMMQQNRGNAMPTPAANQPEISIVVNPRRNSLLVNAPPDRLAVAAQFIKQVDVPSASLQSLADVEARVQVFRLSSLDPEKLAEIVQDMNILEPTTRLRVDNDNQALIVSGSAADRYIIQSLADRLDGSARQFEVLQLRRLDPRDVAESIQFLMGVDEQERASERRRNRFMGFGFFGGNEEKGNDDRFRVAANVRYRQVLLWANESEMEDVRNLLIKLGELPPEGGNRSRRRVIEAAATPETLEYLKQLQQRFNAVAPNPIVLPSEDQFVDPLAPLDNSDADPEAPADDNDAPSTGAKDDASNAPQPPPGRANPNDITIYSLVTATVAASQAQQTTQSQPTTPAQQTTQAQPPTSSPTTGNATPPTRPEVRSGRDFDRLFGAENTTPQSADPSKPTAPRTPNPADEQSAAPIRIEIGPDGNLILSSDDPRALDQLENLMLEVEPPRRPYSIFHVKEASAVWMTLNLEDYFEQEDEDDNGGFPWFIFGMSDQEEESPEGLGRQNSLRFIPDNDTGTIVVTGATPSQLRTIAELIDLWDVPDPLEEKLSRYTRLIPVRYSRAEAVAETIKEAYRDLLSSNDKAFQGGGGGGGGRGGGGGNGGNEPRNRERNQGGGLIDAEGGKDSGPTNFSFKGKLSIGIDPIGNTLLVSAEGEQLLELICRMIEQVDEAAQPQGAMEIREISGTINIDALEKALQFLQPEDASAKPQANPNGNQPAQPPTPPKPAPNRRPNPAFGGARVMITPGG